MITKIAKALLLVIAVTSSGFAQPETGSNGKCTLPELLNLSCSIEDLLLEVRDHRKSPLPQLSKGVPGKLIYSTNTFWRVRWQSNAFCIRSFYDLKHADDLKLTSDFGIASGRYSNAFWTLLGGAQQLVTRTASGEDETKFPRFDEYGKLVIKDCLSGPLLYEESVLNYLCLGFSKLQRGSFHLNGKEVLATRTDGRQITGEVIDSDSGRPKSIRYEVSNSTTGTYHLIDYEYNSDNTSEIPNHITHKQIVPGKATNEEEFVIHLIKTTKQEQPKKRFEPRRFLLANTNVRKFYVTTNDIKMFEDRRGNLHRLGNTAARKSQ